MRHLYSRGRTQCGNRTYATGYAPCELAYDIETHNLLGDLIHGHERCVFMTHFKSGNSLPCTEPSASRIHVVGASSSYHHFVARKRPSDADMQAAADLTGLSRCSAAEVSLRVKEKRAIRVALDAMIPPGAAIAGLPTAVDAKTIMRARDLGVIGDEEATQRMTGAYWLSIQDVKAAELGKREKEATLSRLVAEHYNV